MKHFSYVLILMTALFFSFINVEKEKKYDFSKKNKWQKGILYNLTFSQASLSNWAAGGDKFSISLGSILNMYARYSKDKMRWDNNFDFNLGYVNSTSLGSRKNDDRFDLVSKVGYSLNDKTNLAF